jgi:hypothetical protein
MNRRLHFLVRFSFVLMAAAGLLFASPINSQEVQPGESCPQECDVPVCTTHCEMGGAAQMHCVTTCICQRNKACEQRKACERDKTQYGCHE